MPHLRLEYTDNIPIVPSFDALFETLHSILSEHGISIHNCKSKAIPLNSYYVADGIPDGTFVHLEVRLLEGRSGATKQAIGTRILDALKQGFSTSENHCIQITVEICDIEKPFYFKFPDNLK